MTQQRQFVENNEGVHLVSVAEYTLCGCALEGSCEPSNAIEETQGTKSRIVTCVGCIEIIELCRGVKIKRLDG